MICNTVTKLLSYCNLCVNTLQHYSHTFPFCVEHLLLSQYSCGLRDMLPWNILLIHTKQISNYPLCLVPSALQTICIAPIFPFSVGHSAWNTPSVEHFPWNTSPFARCGFWTILYQSGIQALSRSVTRSLGHSALRNSGSSELKHFGDRPLGRSDNQTLDHSTTRSLDHSITRIIRHSGT